MRIKELIRRRLAGKTLSQLVSKGQALEVRPRHQYVDLFERDPERILQGIDEGKSSFCEFWEKNFT